MKFHGFASDRAAEVELSAVECLTGNEFAGAAIPIVTREGHAEEGKMNVNNVIRLPSSPIIKFPRRFFTLISHYNNKVVHRKNSTINFGVLGSSR